MPDETANAPFQHLVRYCLDLAKQFNDSAYRKRKIEQAEESRRVYEQESRKLSEPWEGAANVELPLTAITVDNMEPRLAAGLIGSEPYVRLEVEGQQQIDDVTTKVQDWFHNELQDVVRLEEVAGDICHDLLLDGTVFPMPVYSLNEKTIKVMQQVDPQALQAAMGQLQQLSQVPPEQLAPEVQDEASQLAQKVRAMQRNVGGVLVDEQGQPQWTDATVREFEGGRVEFLKFTDVLMADDVDDDGYEDAPIFRKVNITYAELMQAKDDPQQKGWIAKNIDNSILPEQTDEKLSAEDQSPAQMLEDIVVHGKKTIPCLECYVSYMYREEHEREEDAKDWTEERLVVLIQATAGDEQGKLLRIRLLRDCNPQNNHLIRRITLYRERGKSYGTTQYHKMRAVQDGATRAFNLAINTGEVTLLPWGFFEQASGLQKLQSSQGQIQIRLGQFLPVDSVKGILFPTMNGNPAGFVQMLEIWMKFWERQGNIGDLQIGTNTSGTETATASLAKIQEGNISHNYRAKRTKGGFLGVIQTIWDLYFAWMPLDKTLKVNGQEQPFPRAMMARGYKLRLTATSEMANKLIKRKENEDFANITGVNKNPGLWNQIKVATDLAKSYDKDSPEEYVNPQVAQVANIAMQAPQLVPVMMQAAQQAMAVAQEIQQGGERKAMVGAAIEMGGPPAGGNGGPAPPGNEGAGGGTIQPKFAPQPQDVIKGVGI